MSKISNKTPEYKVSLKSVHLFSNCYIPCEQTHRDGEAKTLIFILLAAHASENETHDYDVKYKPTQQRFVLEIAKTKRGNGLYNDYEL